MCSWGSVKTEEERELGACGFDSRLILPPPNTTAMAPAQSLRPSDKVKNEEDDQDLAALGFLFDAAAAKAWIKHAFPTSPPSSHQSNYRPALKSIEVEVQVIDDEDGPGALQTGQRTWPAAPFMADYLVRHWKRIAGRDGPIHVLELGAGCGLLGLALAQLPPVEHVIMTDHDPGTMVLIREGIARNHARIREGTRCEAALVEWGGEMDACLLPKPGHGKEGGKDKTPVLLIVGSDLIYSVDVVASLFETVSRVLRKRREGFEATVTATATAIVAATGSDKFLLCGSFVLGAVIDRKVEEVVNRLKLQQEIVSLDDEMGNKEMWMHVYTLPPPPPSPSSREQGQTKSLLNQNFANW